MRSGSMRKNLTRETVILNYKRENVIPIPTCRERNLMAKLESSLKFRRASLFFTIIFGLVVFHATSLFGQDKRDTQKRDLFDLNIPDRAATATLNQPAGIALESTVDPEKYFVGPSDVIAVNIWMSIPQSYPLTVTPEGSLIIPTVGEVMVADLTLARAKEKILKEIRKKYLTAEITATLVKPRPIVVSVIGTVLNPGLYTLNAVDRANKAIEDANKLTRFQYQDQLDVVLRVMSTRNVLLKHKDGSQDRVDLPKYFATREDKWNPYLREGDVVIIPKKDPMKDVFAIYGQVNSSGRYEYVEGDSVLDAIKIANGLTRLSMPEKTIFSRLNQDGTSLSNRDINLTEIMSGREPNIALEPGDRIIVNKKIDLREDYNVDVKGEVLYPGTYPITKNQTRLSEIMKQAGGFTKFASLSSSGVFRQTYKTEDLSNEQLMSLRGGVSTDDSAGFSLETQLRINREAVTADFVKLFEQSDSTQDVILQAEDQIIIPSRHQTIYVFGQVALPGHIPYVKGEEPRYYVNKAGGFTNRANGGNLTIIKSKTKQWVSPGETTLEEGDYIWVPTEPDRPFSYYTTIASQMASVLSVIIGVGVIIIQVTK